MVFHRVSKFFRKGDNEVLYEPIETPYEVLHDDNDVRRPILVLPDEPRPECQQFSWLDYTVFMLLGIAMLWAWNMFLAAAPYFQNRFAEDKAILSRFQAAITSISCITSLFCMLILTNMQSKANYLGRIILALFLSLVVFSLLSISTSHFKQTSPTSYLVFTLIMVFFTAYASSLCQNGSFAYASSFGRPEYIQAIMTGQAIAGVLPAVAQIVSVLSAEDPDKSASDLVRAKTLSDESATAAFTYFMTAAGVSIFTFLAVFLLVLKQNRILRRSLKCAFTNFGDTNMTKRKPVSMLALYKKLPWLSAAVFICLAVTMFFPVFTERITSVRTNEDSRLFRPDAFIPLGFLAWNIGDLVGRLLTLGPFSIRRISPIILFVLACLRVIFIPLYLLCNVGGRDAIIKSDAFYLFVVSGGFGLTNGWLCSVCLMSTGYYVEEGEREAAGGFMIVNLLAGLMAGSLFSFTVSGVGT